jgi:hypothetical protein
MAAISPAAPRPDTEPTETAQWRGSMSASRASIWTHEYPQWVGVLPADPPDSLQ